MPALPTQRTLALALDLGASTGWCIGSLVSGIHGSGWWRLTRPGSDESPGMRYVRLRAELNNMKAAYPGISLVVYERPHMRGRFATSNLLGYASVVQEWCAVNEIQHTDCHSGTLKKWATGKGNASKADMLRAGKARFGPIKPGANDDEIDAMWLLAWAQGTLG